MRGTTALVQADKEVARVTVLEGTIDVLNRVDHSLVRLKPGVVYEIRSRDSALPGAIAPLVSQATTSIAASALAAPPSGATAGLVNSITVPGIIALPLFDSGSTVISLLPLNPAAALAHPLLQGFASQLPSLGLISSALSGLPTGLSDTSVSVLAPETSAINLGVSPAAGCRHEPAAPDSIISAVSKNDTDAAARSTLLSGGVQDSGSRKQLPATLAVIVENTQVLQAPQKLPYRVGPLAGTHFAWPENTAEFPPVGRVVVADDGKVVSLPVFASSQSGPVAAPVNFNFMPGAILPGNIGTSTAGTTAGLFGGIGSITSGIGSVGGVIGGANGTITGARGSTGSVVGGAGGVTGGLLPGGVSGNIGGGGLGGVIPGGGGGAGGLGGVIPGGSSGGLGGLGF